MVKSEAYPEEGNRSLEITANQTNFTDWMYAEISPWISGHILEIGSGLGTYSRYILKDDPKAVLSDVDVVYVKKLNKKFPKNKAVQLDISDEKQIAKLRKTERFDTIIFLNVLEHVEKDEKALRLLRTLLTPNGRIICLVPTHRWLYNPLDKALGHWRRYTKKELKHKVGNEGYEVEAMFSFNFFAIFGWFLNGNILRKKIIGSGSMKLFNSLVGIFKFIEHYMLFQKIGISTIIVGLNKSGEDE
ncbi:class I SAM-dependent methyltransferase [Candidatus Woesearchaeota archaeon]|nr:class I SAM-dependent methyltransferase [Candidatus Woesearchaeota archaeon]